MMNETILCDLTAERDIIACMMIDQRCCDFLEAMLSPRDFVGEGMGQMFMAMLISREAGKDISDPKVLAHELAAQGVRSDLREMTFLFGLLKDSFKIANVGYYAERVKRFGDKRRLREQLNKGLRLLDAPEAEPAEVSELVQIELGQLAIGGRLEPRTLLDVSREWFEITQSQQNQPERSGVFTGLMELDETCGVVQGGELLVVGARPGQGKTVFGAQVCYHNAQQNRSSLIVSLEMKDTELAARYLCNRAGIDSRSIRTGQVDADMLNRLEVALQNADIPAYIYAPKIPSTIPEIRAIARHQKATKGLDLLCVDYVQRIRSTASQSRLEVHEAVQQHIEGLKTLAKELDIPVIALCQLNRSAGNEVPQLHHLARCGAIEMEADAVFLLHHPETTNSPTTQRESHIIIAKHRHSQTGLVKVDWVPSATEFIDRPSAHFMAAQADR